MTQKRVLSVCFILAVALALVPLQYSYAANITVDTTNDVLDAAGSCEAISLAALPGPDGVISLREAICVANDNPGPDTIEFGIPAATDTGCDAGTGQCTIQPVSALPVITDDFTTINGYSQAGATPAAGGTPATVLIQIDGSALASNNGINIASAGNLIQGLAVNRFPWNGIAIGGSDATGNVISGNHIGLDPDGSVDLGNGLDGVFVGLGARNNLIGGDEPAERNVISGNDWEGVGIHGSGTMANTVSGNYIGVSANGLLALGNTLHGVRIYGGAKNNSIGGDAAGERNVVSGNFEDGVRIADEETTNNVVSGNYIGADTAGTTALPNGVYGVMIVGAPDNLIGGVTPGERNVISGNGENGVYIVELAATGNVVLGNYIGVDATGTTALQNDDDGVEIVNAPGNLIGGDTPGERNVISGNGDDGVYIDGADAAGNVISGNYIGVDVSGAAALPNLGDGVQVAAPDNRIGGDAPGERNVISGNGVDGIRMNGFDATGNVVSGNFIGIDASGAIALPNSDDGVTISAGRDNRVGGDTPGERNVISGNAGDGVVINYNLATGNAVAGNYIGVDAGGATALPNSENGVLLDLGAYGNVVGGNTEGERNVISGNGLSGVLLVASDFTASTTGNVVIGNYIGLATDGVTALGNDRGGVSISVSSPDNTIGPGNVIAHNGWDGVRVDTPTSIGNVVTENSIFSNDDLGIDLTNAANNEMPAPTILTAPSGPGAITGAALPGSTVEVFASHDADGEGEIYLGSATAGGAGDYALTVSSLPYPYLTATATDPDDGSSEFSAVFTATVPVLHAGSSKSVNRETASPDAALTYTLTLSNTGISAATASLTDSLPAEVTWANNASASSGVLVWESGNNRLLWSGTVEVGAAVVIGFQVRVNAGLPDGEIISNVATVDDGAGFVFQIRAPDVIIGHRYLYLPLVVR